MSTRLRRIAENTLYNVGTGVVSSAALFLTSVVVARVLGPSDTGIYALVNYAIFGVTTLAATGLSFSVSKFVAQYDDHATHDVVRPLPASASASAWRWPWVSPSCLRRCPRRSPPPSTARGPGSSSCWPPSSRCPQP